MSKVIIYTDGMSKGNPGPASIGALICANDGCEMVTISQAIGRATNNQAEYMAVIAALKMAKELGAREVELRSDSELVVNQINGDYMVKNARLVGLHQEVMHLMEEFDRFNAVSIPREENKTADRLAAKALRKRRTPLE